MSSSVSSEDTSRDTEQQPDFDALLNMDLKSIASRLFAGLTKAKSAKLQPDLPFCSLSIDLVPVHPDLINEPYTLSDTGVRAEIRSTRPYFSIDSATGYCTAGLSYYSIGSAQRSSIQPQKFSSNVSVVDVYDTYGLTMAYSFLHSLYHSSLALANWPLFSAYVLGSLAVLQPETANALSRASPNGEAAALVCCSILLAELAVLESRQPRLVHELQQCTIELPIQLVALIVDSKRVSKELSRYVTKNRAYRELRVGELFVRSRHIVVSSTFSVLSIVRPEEVLTIESEGTTWVLKRRDTAVIACNTYLLGSGTSLCSYSDEARIRQVQPREMLAIRLQSVNTGDELELLRWILLFVIELGVTELSVPRDKVLSVFETLRDRALRA